MQPLQAPLPNNCNSCSLKLNLSRASANFPFALFVVPAQYCKMEKAWVWCCCMLAMAILASKSQAQDTTCMTQLIPCLNYLNSTNSRPPSDCCDPLRSVVKSNPQCLCNMISSNTASSGQSSINVTQAMLLPSRCGVSISSATCAAASKHYISLISFWFSLSISSLHSP